MIFQIIFLYFIIASACLIYGIGIRDLLVAPDNISKIVVTYIKTALCVSIAVFFLWIIARIILIPYQFQFIFPFVSLLILLLVSALLSISLPAFFKFNIQEFSLSYFSAFLALSEGTSLIISLVISLTTVTAYYLLHFLLYCVNRKNDSVLVTPLFNTVSLILITLACIILALYGWNVSWLRYVFFN